MWRSREFKSFDTRKLECTDIIPREKDKYNFNSFNNGNPKCEENRN